jgi:hypothetical protein
VHKRNDAYYTPGWVTQALVPHIPTRIEKVWEPAAGKLSIASELRNAGYTVSATDLKHGQDFFDDDLLQHEQAVITNPPFRMAVEFICRSLLVTQKKRGFVAMLLATDFDHAKTRRHLFGGCRQFAKKLVLTRRIVWFEPMVASPSANHAWFMWDWRRRIVPSIAYYYEEER